MGLDWARKVKSWAQRPNSVPKFRNYNFNTVVLVKYDIILNCIKISGYIGYGHIWGPKGLF